MLNNIIQPFQSAFVPERLIIDNVILAFESLHTLNKIYSVNKGYMGMMFNMSKAYDING